MEERLFVSNEVELYYVVEGQGVPLILCHGNDESSEIFSGLIPMLAKNFKVFALDTRGHGKSASVERLSYDDMASDILNLISHESMEEKPAIIGFSDGGIAALKAAIKSGGTAFSKMVIAGANLNPKGLKWLVRVALKLAYFHTKRDMVRLMLEEPQIDENALSIIESPVLVLAGQNDIIKDKHTRLIANSIKDSELKILFGEQHSTYVFNNKKFYSFIEEFLNRDQNILL